jgi:hypothetical protein
LRINQIANSLRLGQIYPSVEEGTKREFPGFGNPCPFLNDDLKHARKNYWTSMAAYFDRIFAGVGTRAFVISDHYVIDEFIRGGIDYMREPRTVRLPGRDNGIES